MPWAQAKVHTWLLFRSRKGADGAAGSQQNGGQGVMPHELARATLEGCRSSQQALILGEERLYSKKKNVRKGLSTQNPETWLVWLKCR